MSRVFAKAKATSRQRTETQADGESAEMFNEHEYIEALGVGSTGAAYTAWWRLWCIVSGCYKCIGIRPTDSQEVAIDTMGIG